MVRAISEGYHVTRVTKERVHLVEIDADHWKSWVHERLGTPLDAPGSLTFFTAPPNDHRSISMHLTAERRIEEFIAGKGQIVRWERIRRPNHDLDAVCLAAAAGHFAGARLIADPAMTAPRVGKRKRMMTVTAQDGRPFLVTQRSE